MKKNQQQVPLAQPAQVVPTAQGAALGAIERTPPPPGGSTSYTVQSGDAVGKIAVKYGVTTAALPSANGMTNPDLIRVGQKLVIPSK